MCIEELQALLNSWDGILAKHLDAMLIHDSNRLMFKLFVIDQPRLTASWIRCMNKIARLALIQQKLLGNDQWMFPI